MDRTVVIAGASGFVGRALIDALAPSRQVIALSRSPRQSDHPHLEWRTADLFSLADAERALEGADVAVYLVHSMLPTAALTQAGFADLDLVCADNFGRAAAKAGLRRIVYLGGLIPEMPESQLSEHLASRLETERALAAYGVPVTSVRAGLILGYGGSSYNILVRLVRRLPLMITPAWTQTPTQPVALTDVVWALSEAVNDTTTVSRVWDVGCPHPMDYNEMMRQTAGILGLRRRVVTVPLFSARLSRLWVSVFSGTPRALVWPLIESLQHPMLVRPDHRRDPPLRPAHDFEQAMVEARQPPANRIESRASGAGEPRGKHTVRSIQRLPRPPGWDAPVIAREYARWLPSRFFGLVRTDTEGDEFRFSLRGSRTPLLALRFSAERSDATRALYYITGGRLAGHDPADPRPGRLEFRLTPDGRSVLAAVHQFVPRLPWWLYRLTQARLHLWTMRRFGIWLSKQPGSVQEN